MDYFYNHAMFTPLKENQFPLDSNDLSDATKLLKQRSRLQRWLRLIGCFLVGSFFSSASVAQGYQPIVLSGFNQDVVANGNVAPAQSTTTPLDRSGYVMYVRGYSFCSNLSYGLPANGVVNSASTAGVTYNLANYTGNNALFLVNNNSSGILSFTSPGLYSRIAILATSSEGSASVTARLNFSDGSTTDYPFSVSDWYTGANSAIRGFGRVSRVGAACQTDETSGNPRLYDNLITLSTSDRNKVLSSVSIIKTSTQGWIFVMAISGSANTCTNPSVATVSANEDAVCPGEPVTLSVQTGSLNSATNWVWYSGSCGGTPVGTGTSIQVSPTATTTYYVRGEGGCVTPGSCASIPITVNPKPVVTVTNPAAVCSPNTVNLNAAVSVDVTGASFAFFTDAGAANSLPNPGAVSTTGTYYVRATSGAGCVSDIKAISATVNPKPVVTVTNPAAVCSPNTVNLNPAVAADISGSGFAFFTDAGATTPLANPGAVATTGTYYVRATSGAGCVSDIKAINVTVNPKPVVTVTNPTAVCNPNTINLNAAVSVDVSGSSFAFFTDAGAINPLANPGAVATTGTYYVRATSGAGCVSDSKPVVATINPLPTPSITNLASGYCIDAATVPLTGSPGGGSFTIDGAAAGQFNPASFQAGTYTVAYSYTDANGCSATATQPVTVNPLPTPTLGNNGPISSNQPTVTLTAGGGATYAFSTGANQVNAPGGNTATVTTPGLYSVTAISAAGCRASAQTTVTGAVSPVVCRGKNAVLSVTAAGSGLTYQWFKNGQTAANRLTEIASVQRGTTTASLTLVNAQTTANYFVRVTDANAAVVWYGPFKVTVNANCGGRLAAEVTETDLQVTLMPNPLVEGRLLAIIRGGEGQPLSLQLVDTGGKSVRTQQWAAAGAEQVVDWDVNAQPAGLYVLRAISSPLTGPAKSVTLKVVKP